METATIGTPVDPQAEPSSAAWSQLARRGDHLADLMLLAGSPGVVVMMGLELIVNAIVPPARDSGR